MPYPTFGRLSEVGRRAPPTPPPPNHNLPWSPELEDEQLRQFSTGRDVPELALSFGRTHGAIHARLSMLLGIRYPETPLQYRRRGEPIRRGGRRHMPLNLEALRAIQASPLLDRPIPPAAQAPTPSLTQEFAWPAMEVTMRDLEEHAIQAASIRPPPGQWANLADYDRPLPANWPQASVAMPPPPPGYFDISFDEARGSRILRQEFDRRGNLRPPETGQAPPAPETPPHLEAAMHLKQEHYDKLAGEIHSLRPTYEGRAAVAQHSTLNRLAYKMAALFEGDNSSFDRGTWLTACGVTNLERETP